MDSFESLNDMSTHFVLGQPDVYDISTPATDLPVNQFSVEFPPGTLCIIA
jgi:hypothetical protein